MAIAMHARHCFQSLKDVLPLYCVEYGKDLAENKDVENQSILFSGTQFESCFSLELYGIFCMRLSAGLSTERARTTNVPTTNFTHSIWRAANGILPDEMDVTMLIVGGSPEKIAVTESVTREAIVAVNWNCAYIWMLLYMPLPHFIAFAMGSKLSPEILISDFSIMELDFWISR